MEGNAGSGAQPLLRPPVPHRATNHSSILESESLARKGTPYLLKSPEITKEEPWFPSQSILRCSKPRRGWGSHPERHSGDRGGVCWAEEGMAMFLRCCFQHLSLPRGLQCVCLPVCLSFSSNIRTQTQHHNQPDHRLDPQSWKKSKVSFIRFQTPTKTKSWLLSRKGSTLSPCWLLTLRAHPSQPFLQEIFTFSLYSLVSD